MARDLLYIEIIPFEPVATGRGRAVSEKRQRLIAEFRSRKSDPELEELREKLKGQLVKLSVEFRLWKGSSTITNTRPVKDLDNLMKVLFDALGNRGLRLLDEDSYICDVRATKKIVGEQAKEGYRVLLKKHRDPEMLKILEGRFSGQ